MQICKMLALKVSVHAIILLVQFLPSFDDPQNNMMVHRFISDCQKMDLKKNDVSSNAVKQSMVFATILATINK